jgi:hypothetical protein
MKTLRMILSIGALVLVSAETDGGPSYNLPVGNPPPRYRLVIKDNPTAERFDLTLHSDDSRAICLGQGGWPNQLGNLDWGSQWVKLQSGKKVFKARDWNFGYCDGAECSTRVPPYGTLTGFIGYAEFGDPKEIAVLPKRRLHFDPLLYVCNPEDKGTNKTSK